MTPTRRTNQAPPFVPRGRIISTVTTAWESFADYFRRMQSTSDPLLPVAHKQTMTPTRRMPRGRILCSPSTPIPLSTTDRAEYSKYGCTVYGWPSTGGVIARSDCDLVELSYLGLDPLDALELRDKDQEQEDEFCTRLRMIGGKWWRNRREFLVVRQDEWLPNRRPTDDELGEVYIGWPEGGGVLALEGVKDLVPWDIGILRLATTMEERCRLLRDRLGAAYYEDPMAYPGFTGLDPGNFDIKEDSIEA